MANTLATKITITADDKASGTINNVADNYDQAAARLLRMGASLDRAFKALDLDFLGSSDLGKFSQQMSTLTGQFSILRRQAGSDLAALKTALLENIALIGMDTEAYAKNTKAAIENRRARLDYLDKAITANNVMMEKIQKNTKFEYLAPGPRLVVMGYRNKNKELIAEQTVVTEELAKAEKNLAAVTELGTGKFAALGRTMSVLKTGAMGLINMLGGPWAIGLAAAAAAVGYLASSEDSGEEIAKKYGHTLESLQSEYDALVKSTDSATDAQNKFNNAQRAIALETSARKADEAREKIRELQESLASLASFQKEMQEDTLGFSPVSNIEAFPNIAAKYKTAFQEIVKAQKEGKISAQDAQDAVQNLMAQMKKEGVSEAFINSISKAVIMFQELSLAARDSQNAVSAWSKIAFVPPDSQLQIKEMREAQEETKKLYAQTKEGQKAALEKAIAEAKHRNALLHTSETAAVLAKAEKDLADFQNKGAKASGGAAKAAFQVAEAYERATDATEQLRLKQAELLAELAGSGLAENLAKIGRDYTAQLDAIRKKERELVSNRPAYVKAGKTSAYEETLLEIQAQKQLLEENRKINEELVKRQNIEAALKNIQFGQEQQLADQMTGLSQAYEMAAISLDQYRLRLTDVRLELAQLHQDQGFATFTENISLALSRITEGYRGVAAGLTDTFGQAASSITSGFSNAIGQAIWDTENFTDALRNVARQGISSVISGLLQLGIQWAVSAALQQTVSQSSATASVAMAQIVGPAIAKAYTPAAIMASLATSGGNAIGAMGGMTATTALATGLSILGGFAAGGYTGDYPTDKIVGAVHGGEYVMDAATVNRYGVGYFDELRAAPNASRYAGASMYDAGSPMSGGGGTQLNVSFANYGTPKDVEIQQLSPEDVRIIARDVAREEAEATVRRDAPKVVAADYARPNSHTAKAWGQFSNAQRRRG